MNDNLLRLLYDHDVTFPSFHNKVIWKFLCLRESTNHNTNDNYKLSSCSGGTFPDGMMFLTDISYLNYNIHIRYGGTSTFKVAPMYP